MAPSAVRVPKVTCDERSVIGFKNGQAGIEQLALGHDNHVAARRDLVSPENLSYQSLGAIPHDRAAQFSRRGDSEPPRALGLRQHEHRAEPAADPGPALVDQLEIGAATDVLRGPEADRRALAADSGKSYSLLTVRRLRPFARRRFSTRRPFFVLIRTRNPWVRFRRRRFG